MIKNLTDQMQTAAKNLDFEEAANLRDAIQDLQNQIHTKKTKKGGSLSGK